MQSGWVINAGIKTVVIRGNKDEYTIYEVADWVKKDESRDGVFGY